MRSVDMRIEFVRAGQFAEELSFYNDKLPQRLKPD